MSLDEVPILRDENDETNDLNYIEIKGWKGNFFCHPQRLGHKSIALFLMCMLGFGSYYCYDNPGALQNELIDALSLTKFQFANLYSLYAWPNVFLPILGGYIMDSFLGRRRSAILFSIFILAGQIILGAGGLLHSILLMDVGRFVFGLGGESLAVVQNTYASAWFSGKALNMVFGFQLSVARLGSSINYWTISRIFTALKPYFDEGCTTVGWTLIIASLTCCLSLISAIILGYLDKRAFHFSEVSNKRRHEEEEERMTNEKIKLKDILTFPVSFWLLSLICVFYYVAVFPFVSLGQIFFMKKYDYTEDSANSLTGLIYMISAFASPIFGFVIDRIGRNILFVTFGVGATLLSHTLLSFTFCNPTLPIILMGLSYSLLASALWPICTLVIPEYQLGTAFGFMQAIQNLGLAVVPLAAGSIVDYFGYIWLELFFMFWLVLSLVTSVLLWVIDLFWNNGYLNMTPGQRKFTDSILIKNPDM